MQWRNALEHERHTKYKKDTRGINRNREEKHSRREYGEVEWACIVSSQTVTDRIAKAAAVFDAKTQETALRILQLTPESLSTLEALQDSDNHGHRAQLSREQILTQISLPIAQGGLGIRPVDRIRYAAFFSSLLQIVPDFLTLFPALQFANVSHVNRSLSNSHSLPHSSPHVEFYSLH